jgi:hypothetical protein
MSVGLSRPPFLFASVDRGVVRSILGLGGQWSHGRRTLISFSLLFILRVYSPDPPVLTHIASAMARLIPVGMITLNTLR